MLQIIGIASGLFATIGLIPYIIDIFKHKTKPERASWLIWSVLAAIAFFSQLADGATSSLWMTAFQTFNVALVFLLSIKFGSGGLVKRDIAALLMAGVGLLMWWITNSPVIALVIVVLVDAIGVYLTFTKTLKEPESETLSAWVLASVSGFLGAVAVGSLDFSLILYPLYIGLANSAITFAIWYGRRKKALSGGR